MNVQEELGKIQINEDVLVTIASLAALEIEGVASIAGSASLADVWSSKGMKKGVTVTTDEDGNYAVIDVQVNVAYGVDVYQVAHQLQRTVKNAIETMTGLRVKSVNVKIAGIERGPRTPRQPAGRNEPAGEEG